MKTHCILLLITAMLFASCEKAQTPELSADAPEVKATATVLSHTYQLEEGWNDISFYLQGESDDIADILAPIADKIVICKDFTGVYWPSQGINQINDIDYAKGFIINVSESCEFTHTGTPVSAEVILHEGWNLVGMPYDTPQPVGTIYPISANSSNNIVKNAIGGLVYWPYYGIGQIVEALPGRAYKVHLE